MTLSERKKYMNLSYPLDFVLLVVTSVGYKVT
jgi:hypothetical protein